MEEAIYKTKGNVREKIGGMRYCPVTGNQPTRMTKASFSKICADYRSRSDGNSGWTNEGSGYKKRLTVYCETCKGKILPDNLEFIDIDTLKKDLTKERTMVKNDKGICACCRESDRALKRHLGEMVCSSCQILRIAARNRPWVVQRAMQEFGHWPETGGVEIPLNSEAIPGTRVPGISEEARRTAEDNGGHGIASLAQRVDALEQIIKPLRIGEMMLQITSACLCENNGGQLSVD